MAFSHHAALLALAALPAIAGAQVTPGQWQTTATVESVEMPGAPPQIAQMMRGRMGGGPHVMSYCITPEQAAQGPKEMFKNNPSCRFTSFSMSGGKISTEMVCSQNGGTMTARATGSYTPTSFDVRSKIGRAHV